MACCGNLRNRLGCPPGRPVGVNAGAASCVEPADVKRRAEPAGYGLSITVRVRYIRTG